MTPQPPTDAAREVTQEDREAAAFLFLTLAPSILAREMDETENVQAFARHRLAERERCDAAVQAEVDRCRAHVAASRSWSPEQAEWSRARDTALNIQDAIRETNDVG